MSYTITTAKFLSDSHYKVLMDTIKAITPEHPRDATMLLLLANTGARPSEILNLRVKDLNPEKRTVFIRGLKRSYDRELPVVSSIYEGLERQVKGKADDDLVFGITLRTLQWVWDKYRPCKKGVKSLRHSFALRVYKKTKDIRLVQRALGHKSLLNTMVYADYVYNEEEFRRLIL